MLISRRTKLLATRAPADLRSCHFQGRAAKPQHPRRSGMPSDGRPTLLSQDRCRPSKCCNASGLYRDVVIPTADKRQVVYPELVAAQRCKLVVLALRLAAASTLRHRLRGPGIRQHPRQGRFRAVAFVCRIQWQFGRAGPPPPTSLSVCGRWPVAPAFLKRAGAPRAFEAAKRPAAYLRRGGRADGRPAVGSSRPREIMSCRHKRPGKQRKTGQGMLARSGI